MMHTRNVSQEISIVIVIFALNVDLFKYGIFVSHQIFHECFRKGVDLHEDANICKISKFILYVRRRENSLITTYK